MDPYDPASPLNPGVEPMRFEAWRTYVQTYGVIADLVRRRFAETLDLPLVWYEILLHVNSAECGQRPFGELEELIVFSQSGLSQLLTRMEAQGLLCRDADPDDARRTVVVLTDAGRALLTQCAEVHRGSIDEYFAGRLTDDEARMLGHTLGRLLQEVRPLRKEQLTRPAARRRRRRLSSPEP
jgi:DNA-binding MarR family transcriptional regulator